MTLKDKILETKNLLLLRSGATPKENLRSAYELALMASGCEGLKEPAAAMFDRAGRFCDFYIATLNEIAGEIYEDLGLTGGAAPASLADVGYLSIDEARKLLSITFAQHEAETIRRDLIAEFKAWATRNQHEDIAA